MPSAAAVSAVSSMRSFAVVVVRGEMFGLGARSRAALVVVRGDDEPALQIAVVAGKFENEIARFLAQRPQIARVLLAQPPLEFRLVLAVAGMDLSAIAARRGEADGLSLDAARPSRQPGEVERGREARIAAADDADVGVCVALETGRRESRRPRARRIIALWRFAAHQCVIAGAAWARVKSALTGRRAHAS